MRFKRYTRHIAQTYYRAFGIGTYDNLLKLRYRRQTPLCGNRHSDIESLYRLLSEHSCRRLSVLVLESFLKVGDSDAKVGHLVGLDPYLHRIISSSYIAYASNAREAAYKVYHIQCDEITEIYLIKLRVGAGDRHGHQLAWRLALDTDTVLYHFRGQTRLCEFYAILYLYSRQLGICRYVKRNRGIETARIVAGRLHIKHTGRTVKFLLDRSGHRLRYSERVGSGI